MAQPRKTTKKDTKTATPVRRSTVRKGVTVRFHADENKWAILGDDMNPTEYFTHGYMKNVTFDKHKISNGMSGCGRRYSFVGIAKGDLVTGKYHKDQIDLVNLGFNGQNFVDITKGTPFKGTPLLHLLPDRKALAKNPEGK